MRFRRRRVPFVVAKYSFALWQTSCISFCVRAMWDLSTFSHNRCWLTLSLFHSSTLWRYGTNSSLTVLIGGQEDVQALSDSYIEKNATLYKRSQHFEYFIRTQPYTLAVSITSSSHLQSLSSSPWRCTYKFKSSQASKARLQSSRHIGTKQKLTQNGDSRSFKITCFGVSGKAIRH